jgi:hypothetical protein
LAYWSNISDSFFQLASTVALARCKRLKELAQCFCVGADRSTGQRRMGSQERLGTRGYAKDTAGCDKCTAGCATRTAKNRVLEGKYSAVKDCCSVACVGSMMEGKLSGYVKKARPRAPFADHRVALISPDHAVCSPVPGDSDTLLNQAWQGVS